MRKIALSICILLCSLFQTQADGANQHELFNKIIQSAKNLDLYGKPVDYVLPAVGKLLLGTPYTEKSLDQDTVENLVVRLDGVDCTTFVETALALSRCISSSRVTYSDFENELTKIRYRGGKLNSYTSRLHYFSEWIIDNSAKGIVKDVTHEVGGEEIIFKLNFMSTHKQLYPQLSLHPEFVDSIRNVEKNISGKTFFELAKTKVPVFEKDIHSGDIIAFTTDIKGLDVSHVGIVVSGINNKLYLLHASSANGQVMLSEYSLYDYVAKHKHDKGIIVLRPQPSN